MHILVTGASSGIGYAIVDDCLQHGYTVWAAARNPAALDSLKNQSSAKLKIVRLDVTCESEIEVLSQQISTALSNEKLILINNAGIAGGGPIEAIPLAQWRSIFDVNLFGAIAVTKSFMPLIRSSKGRVINIGSVSGRVSAPFLAPYAASKFALRAFTDSLRREVLSFGVKVCLIEPGPIATPIWNKSLKTSNELRTSMDPNLLKLYGPVIDQLVSGVNKTAATAVPVEHVLKKVRHAITSDQPKIYYRVGKNIHILFALINLLPSALLDRLLAKGFRFSSGD